MHIGQIIRADSANGTGIRLSVFVSGCTNHCEGCFQPETWNFEYGILYTPEIEGNIIMELSKDYYQGITILGGEPFELENQKEVLKLLKRVNKELPQKDVWMYTGFSYEKDLQPGGIRYGQFTDELLNSIDILVDGKFDIKLKNIRLKFRGSENQQIIDMKKTRRKGTVCLAEI